MKKILVLVVVILVAAGGYFYFNQKPKVVVTNFKECADTGVPVMESYPRQCIYNGVTYVEEVEGGDQVKNDEENSGGSDDDKKNQNTGGKNGSGGSSSGGSGILPFDSGVEGFVLLGPTCPVMWIPPDPGCADKPYETMVQVIAKNSPKSSPFAISESDTKGHYKFMLPPGEYTVMAVSKKIFPTCAPEDITIEPGKVKKLDISCDTGIR